MKNRKSFRTLWVLIAALLLCVCFPVVANADNTVYHTVKFLDGMNGEAFEDYSTTLPKGTLTPNFRDLGIANTDGPSCTGFTYDGWDPPRDDTVNGDVVYTAKWKDSRTTGQVVYTVVYKDDVNGKVFKDRVNKGIIPNATTPPFATAETEPTEPRREGYTFTGWKNDLDGAWSKNVTGYTRYTAQWEKNPSQEPEQSQGPIYYPDYDESPEVTPVPTPTPEPVADEEDVSPKTGAAEVSLPALAVVALAAAAMMVRMMRKRDA